MKGAALRTLVWGIMSGRRSSPPFRSEGGIASEPSENVSVQDKELFASSSTPAGRAFVKHQADFTVREMNGAKNVNKYQLVSLSGKAAF